MTTYLQQEIDIKFLTKFLKSGSEICEILKEGSSEEAVSCAHVFSGRKNF
jgi:hypothetical protein